MCSFVIFCQVGYSGQPLGEDVHFAVLHSAWHTSGSAAVIHVVCVYVDANKEAESEQDGAPLFTTKLEWLTFFTSGCFWQFVPRTTHIVITVKCFRFVRDFWCLIQGSCGYWEVLKFIFWSLRPWNVLTFDLGGERSWKTCILSNMVKMNADQSEYCKLIIAAFALEKRVPH